MSDDDEGDCSEGELETLSLRGEEEDFKRSDRSDGLVLYFPRMTVQGVYRPDFKGHVSVRVKVTAPRGDKDAKNQEVWDLAPDRGSALPSFSNFVDYLGVELEVMMGKRFVKSFRGYEKRAVTCAQVAPLLRKHAPKTMQTKPSCDALSGRYTKTLVCSGTYDVLDVVPSGDVKRFVACLLHNHFLGPRFFECWPHLRQHALTQKTEAELSRILENLERTPMHFRFLSVLPHVPKHLSGLQDATAEDLERSIELFRDKKKEEEKKKQKKKKGKKGVKKRKRGGGNGENEEEDDCEEEDAEDEGAGAKKNNKRVRTSLSKADEAIRADLRTKVIANGNTKFPLEGDALAGGKNTLDGRYLVSNGVFRAFEETRPSYDSKGRLVDKTFRMGCYEVDHRLCEAVCNAISEIAIEDRERALSLPPPSRTRLDMEAFEDASRRHRFFLACYHAHNHLGVLKDFSSSFSSPVDPLQVLIVYPDEACRLACDPYSPNSSFVAASEWIASEEEDEDKEEPPSAEERDREQPEEGQEEEEEEEEEDPGGIERGSSFYDTSLGEDEDDEECAVLDLRNRRREKQEDTGSDRDNAEDAAGEDSSSHRYVFVMEAHRLPERVLTRCILKAVGELEGSGGRVKNIVLFGDRNERPQGAIVGAGQPFHDLFECKAVHKLYLRQDFDAEELRYEGEGVNTGAVAVKKSVTDFLRFGRSDFDKWSLSPGFETVLRESFFRYLAWSERVRDRIVEAVRGRKDVLVYCDDPEARKQIEEALYKGNRFRKGDRVQISREDTTVYTITDFFESDENAIVPEKREHRQGVADDAHRFVILEEPEGVPEGGMSIYHDPNKWNRVYVSVRPYFEHGTGLGPIRNTSSDDVKVPFTLNKGIRRADVYGLNSLHQAPASSLGIYVFDPLKCNHQTFYTFLKKIYTDVLLVTTKPAPPRNPAARNRAAVVPAGIQKPDVLRALLTKSMIPRQTVFKTHLRTMEKTLIDTGRTSSLDDTVY